MADTLASLTDDVELYLADKSNKSWGTDTLELCIRLALEDIVNAAGVTYTIDDLDAATATTLPDRHIPALILGAAAYAAKTRAVDRLEKVSLAEGPGGVTLGDWGNWQMILFQKRLEEIRAQGIHGSTSAPHTAADWEEEPKTW